MVETKKLTASSEDYLETIFNIISEKGAVRAKDIARYLGVKAGSVTTALQALSKSKHINYKPYEIITLTSKGFTEVREIVRKHEVLRDFFTDVLGASLEVAEDGACKIEHVISEDLMNRLVSFTEFVQSCPRCGDDLVSKFHKSCKDGTLRGAECETCISECRENFEKEQEEMLNTDKTITLFDIPNAEKCVVKRINKKALMSKRLVEMGVGRGVVIEVERVAPLGDPIEVKVKGYHLSIRKEDAKNIVVEKK